MITDEPVRGGFPDPALYHLPGIDQARAYVRNQVPRPPAWPAPAPGRRLASRVQAAAGPGEVLVSSTVRDLVAGSGLRFGDRVRHELKGLEGEWHLLAVED